MTCLERGVKGMEQVRCAHYIPMTNGDSIRAMTDTELAAWLTNFCCATCGSAATARKAMLTGDMMGWLREREEDE